MTNKVTDLIKQQNTNGNGVVELSTGVKVKFNMAPVMLVEQAVSRVKFPEVPEQTLEDGRKVQNPNHPQYLKDRLTAIRLQSQAAIDVMIAFVDLADGMPENNDWVKRIDYLSKRGHIDLGDYDLTDELDREFVYKKYIAFGNDDLEMLSQANGITEADRQLAKNSFRGSKESS